MNVRIRGIKRHGVIQRRLKLTGKSNVRSLDDAVNSLTGGENNSNRRRVFNEVPFGKSRVDIVVTAPGVVIFVEFKTTKLARTPNYGRQVKKSFGDFMNYVNFAPQKFISNGATNDVKFYYLLTVEKCGGKGDDTTVIYDGLVIPGLKYDRMFTELADRYKVWIREKIVAKTRKLVKKRNKKK